MFKKEIYIRRREELIKKVKSGIILMLGNDEIPMNYAANPYYFRQDSTFLYYFGLDLPGLSAIINADENECNLFGDDPVLDDIIWMGPQEPLSDQAAQVGVEKVSPSGELENVLKKTVSNGCKVHFLPPYRAEHQIKYTKNLHLKNESIIEKTSSILIKAVIEQRSVKIEEEIEEIEKAHSIAYEMHTTAMRMSKAGIYERDISGAIEGIALAAGGYVAFPVILSRHGEILHNHHHGNLLRDGDMVINDSGAENSMHYASDITRTFPVSGKFTMQQKEIYEIVLKAQIETINSIEPDIKNLDIHLKAAAIITDGLKDLGLMRGDTKESVKVGAHALFFPHGLGHMMGLDVHDMENLGEDLVGYDKNVKRSDQFGLAYLRLGKKLQPGYVLTIEPGIYFIPELIRAWQKEKKFEQFIDYSRIGDYIEFGGIRIEDNIVVTDDGHRIIGNPIPKSVGEVEQICQESFK
jgi:Xaa-Pro aminopeptidase